MSEPIPDHVTKAIAATKTMLRSRCDIEQRFAQVRDDMARQAAEIQTATDAGRSVVPEVAFEDIARGTVSNETIAQIHHRGCVVVRQVFPQATARAWNEELGEYLASNNYVERAEQAAAAAAEATEFFEGTEVPQSKRRGTPQIFGIYWSRPQVLARQAESMATTKRFLNRLWDTSAPAGPEFDPDNDVSYADRIRRRDPGDQTLGLRPHTDGGSFERWVDPAYQAIYAPIFGDDWTSYDPWRAAYRSQTREFDSPTVCSAFRTFQGWTALTTQGPTNGTLQLLPVANAMAYVLLRSLLDDVADAELLLADPGRVLRADEVHHPELLEAMVSIPVVEPGDTVWWHPDLIHGVEDEHQGHEQANVIYIAATPDCPKNLMYARQQAAHFLDGRSSPDFPEQNLEVNFAGRATLDDLTPLGRRQMAL